jgi:restriction endonuclease Mrr
MNFKTLKERLKMTNKYTFEVIDYGEMLEREAKRITKDMDEYIIKKFNISPKDYSMLNDYENTTIFAYRMCWIRTELRKEGLIENPKKGIWKLVR